MVDIDEVIPTELELLRLKAAILELEADAKVQQGRLRDQFAMAVLQGLCAQSQIHAMSHRPEDTAGKAYRLADAMLAARDK